MIRVWNSRSLLSFNILPFSQWHSRMRFCPTSVHAFRRSAVHSRRRPSVDLSTQPSPSIKYLATDIPLFSFIRLFSLLLFTPAFILCSSSPLIAYWKKNINKLRKNNEIIKHSRWEGEIIVCTGSYSAYSKTEKSQAKKTPIILFSNHRTAKKKNNKKTYCQLWTNK